jgi:hypothetical protein
MPLTTYQLFRFPTRIPSMTKLWVFDGRLCDPLGIINKLPIQIGSNIVLVEVVVITTLIDSKLLLGHNNLYAMKSIATSLFHMIMFHHEGCIVTINQFSYYDV